MARAAGAAAPRDLTRRERRKLEVRNRILEASVELFGQQGVTGTKVSEICARADVAHKTFFNHFPSRAHLLREIARDSIDQLLADLDEARRRPSGTRDRIRHFFSHAADVADEAGPMQRELLTEIVHAAHERGGGEPTRRLHDAFAAIVAEGVAAGDVSERADPETLTDVLMGAYYALMFNWANLEDYPLRERALATAGFLADSMTGPGEESDA